MADRQRINRTKDRIGVGLFDEFGELRCPTVEFFRNISQASPCVAEIDGLEPIFWLVHGYIRMQRSA